ncbi:MAG: cadmium-translocating P-type ATPase [Planctomycetes bacterium]|nr:cadmium-translocating P-type ATPase [Planctomycetota bacterium]
MSSRDLQFHIEGMDCSEEISILRRELTPLVGPGEDRLGFDLLGRRLTVRLPEGSPASAATVVAAIAATGMKATPVGDVSTVPDPGTWWSRHGRAATTAGSGVAAALGLTVHALLAGDFFAALGSEGMGVADAVPLPARAAYLVSVILGAWPFLPKAWLAARRLSPDMNLLMTVAVAGALAIGEWFEGAVVAFLFSLSLLLESWSVDRARRAVRALMALAPPTVHLLKDGTEAEVAAEGVPVGARFVVKPGERVALDGTVVRGSSTLDQSPITGESMPVSKAPGETVFAGTINGDGALEVESTKLAGDTTLAHIIKMVGEAQAGRAPSERWVETFARYYTPAILALALGLLLVPPLAFGLPWSDWIYRSLVLLVIGCPCALVISTPVSVVASIAAAARNGVLVKGGAHVETPATLVALALDKTGTITEGKPRVTEVTPMNGHTERELLELAGAIEARSEHPLARAIVKHVQERGVTVRPADDVQTVQGKGVTARIDGRVFWLGSHRYLQERGQETADVQALLAARSTAGQSVVLVGDEAHVCGVITLADTVRPGVAGTLKALRAAGVKHIAMLTGDNAGTAKAIAAEAGIDEVHAELLPSDKVRVIDALVAKHGRVAMIGDGVNDAPALARASLGIAMGAAGSDAAIETADVALMSDDLGKLPWLVLHSRRTLRVIRQNVFFSLAVKAVFVVLTFAGHASLWAAIGADMGASLLVILNGLRLLGGGTDQESAR